MIEQYIVLFVVSTILVAIAGAKGNRSKFVRWMFGAAAVALVSVFAGIRDFGVGGPDVMVYGNRVFDAMVATPDIGSIMQYTADRGVSGEVGYYFLNWVVTRFSTDPHVFYTLLTAICSTAILIAIMLLREYGPVAVMWLTYMLTAYIEGFNLLRQSPALALTVLGVALVMRSRYLLGLIVGAAGLLFHNSAIVFLIIWAVAVYLKTRRERIGRSIWIVLLLTVVGLAAIAPILDILSTSLADSKYQEYLGEGARGGRAIGIDALYRAVPLLLGIWVLVGTRPGARTAAISRRSPSFTRMHGRVAVAEAPIAASTEPSTLELAARRATLIVLVLLVVELILLPAREISYPFYRLLAYFGYLRILGYGLIVGRIPSYRFAAGAVAVAFAAAYFAFIVIGRNEAFYASAILDEWLKTR